MLNYRTKGATAKTKANVPRTPILVLDDDILKCKSSNLNSNKCEKCENKFKCLLVDIPDIKPLNDVNNVNKKIEKLDLIHYLR
jgi:hypothetical protein